MLDSAWLIPVLPLVAFLIIVFFTLRFKALSGYISIAAVFGSFVLAVGVLLQLAGAGAEEPYELTVPWFTVGDAHFELGLLIDPLTAIMLVVVTSVSLLVQIYSQGYMKDDPHTGPGYDPGYSRFFAFLSLFTMSMLGLVLAPNFVQLYIFWELVGLCSYLLIGFWYRKPEAAAAAKKAFITTRLGDLGLLIGILVLYWSTHSFSFAGIEHAVAKGEVAGALLTTAMVLVFCGAVGKSAQFPLHVWLPDAMEGPTPVSALIHAATMVAAGVYLVARAFAIFHAAPDSMLVVAYIGGITAFIAATMGVVMTDIKRVMAYSTISQLGYMMLGLGVAGLAAEGSYVAGISHLTNHAFFKALLFLGAGSVIHATGTQDMDEMGGLFGKMKITATTLLVASLALAGIPPLSGFWSKDEILVEAYHYQPPLFWLALFTAGLTAFYVFRMWIRTFTGQFRLASPAHGSPGSAAGGHASHAAHDSQAGHSSHHAHGGNKDVHESPAVMTVPLILLAIASVLSGFLGSPFTDQWYGRFMEGGEFHAVPIEPFVMGSSVLVAVVGIFLAWATYSAQWISAASIRRAFPGVHSFLVNKYRLDDLYLWLIRRVVLGLSNLFQVFDLSVIDGIVNGVGRAAAGAGSALRAAQTGRVQNYGIAFFGGVVIVAVFTVFIK